MRNFGITFALAQKAVAWTLAVGVAVSTVACSDDGGKNGDAGSEGGSSGSSAGAGGRSGGSGGSAGSAGGSGGTNTDAGAGTGATADAGDAGPVAPPFVVTAGTALPNNAQLPISVDFAAPTDVTGKFKVFERPAGAVSHDPTSGGRLKIAKGTQGMLFYDPTPADGVGNVGVEEFTASLTFKADAMPNVYFAFAGDDKRSNTRQAMLQFNNGKDGPVGIADVDGFLFKYECSPQFWQVVDKACLVQIGEAYAAGAAQGGPSTYRFEITVKKAATEGQLYVYAAYWQDGEFIDHQVITYSYVTATAGEIGIGASPVGGDIYIDDFKVEAAKAIPDMRVQTHKGADGVSWFLWLPEGAGPINGLLHFAPSMMMPVGSVGEFALFDHHRRFAAAHRWGLISHHGKAPDMVASADAAVVALATASAHAEVKDVPWFVHGLLTGFAHQFANAHPEKTLGWFLDKPDMMAMAGVPTEAMKQVPGIITYSPTSAIGGLSGASPIFKAGRETGALWGLAAHGAQTHAVVDSFALYYTYLERLIALRMTNGAGPLKPLVKTQGWLGESKPFLTEEFAVVTPPPAADVVTQSWLPDEHVAMVFSAFHYMRFQPGTTMYARKRAHFMAAPRHGKAGESRTMTVGFVDPAVAWKKIEFFDMATKVGEVVTGAMPQFTYPALKKGVHTFTARVTDSADKVILVLPTTAIMAP